MTSKKYSDHNSHHQVILHYMKYMRKIKAQFNKQNSFHNSSHSEAMQTSHPPMTKFTKESFTFKKTSNKPDKTHLIALTRNPPLPPPPPPPLSLSLSLSLSLLRKAPFPVSHIRQAHHSPPSSPA